MGEIQAVIIPVGVTVKTSSADKDKLYSTIDEIHKSSWMQTRDDTSKSIVPIFDLSTSMPSILEKMQDDRLSGVKKEHDEHCGVIAD
ncbi:uncharacterized protein PV09_08737 [Verruconis gallopava]|uniref:Uncharacterized protein n=1 Tax=Verruconis gallopava TaxID=253628 RepID=A0A0D1ZYR6_9PEZI|nr:uncharacterized protein PV09_08737 [Verruconis gallopava]KIV99557.1 hypothetical protein PV09_08737 [Verruconis gallopava]